MYRFLPCNALDSGYAAAHDPTDEVAARERSTFLPSSGPSRSPTFTRRNQEHAAQETRPRDRGDIYRCHPLRACPGPHLRRTGRPGEGLARAGQGHRDLDLHPRHAGGDLLRAAGGDVQPARHRCLRRQAQGGAEHDLASRGHLDAQALGRIGLRLAQRERRIWLRLRRPGHRAGHPVRAGFGRPLLHGRSGRHVDQRVRVSRGRRQRLQGRQVRVRRAGLAGHAAAGREAYRLADALDRVPAARVREGPGGSRRRAQGAPGDRHPGPLAVHRRTGGKAARLQL